MNNLSSPMIKQMLQHISVGDSLGKICSKYSSKEIIKIYGGPITELVAPKRKKSNRVWDKGYITDDTILTILVADSLIERRGFDRKDIARRLIACDPVGGNQIYKLKDSNDLTYVAQDGETNGASIRVSSLPVVYKEISELTEKVVMLSNLTHGTNESIGAALYVSYALHYFMEGKNTDLHSFLVESVADNYKQAMNTKVTHALNNAFELADSTPIEELTNKLEERIGYSKYSWSSVPAAITLGSFAKNNYKMFIDIIHRKKSMWDLDSTASIAGGLMGLRNYDVKVDKMSKTIESVNNISFSYYTNKLLKLREKINDG